MIEINTNTNFNQDVVNVDNANIPSVDLATAQKVGDRTIGAIKNATWYELDNYSSIIYKDRYYKIAPLSYGDLFKFMKAKNTFAIPGYVLVDTITQDAEYVELEKPIKYAPSAVGHYDLRRTLRRNFSSYVFENSVFEIDDEGNPYWVTSVTKPTIGVWKARKITSIIVTDATTGKSDEYSLNDIPNWIDNVYSLDYIMKLVDYNLKYVNGYWNFSHTGVNRTTYSYKDETMVGYNVAVTSDGNLAYYTGVTPYNNAETNLAFILASTKTGEIKYYNCAGAEESSAQAAAQGLVQNLGYVATFPNVINVDGVETYFMALKDAAGLVQRYSLCQISNYTNVVEAPTLKETLVKYRVKIGVSTAEETNEKTEQVVGQISTIYQANIEGYTYYYFTLDDSDKLFMSSIINSNRQVMMGANSKVTIEYKPSNEENVLIVTKILFE